MSEWVLAFDFGGTKLSAALISLTAVNHPDFVAGERAWQARRRVFSPPEATAQTDVATMITLGRELLADKRPLAIGVSFGGPVEFEAGMVRLSHHVPGWENTPLQTMLAVEFGAPVWVDNDANVAALGEYRFGAGRGCDHLLYVTVSTGVGGGWILDGRPFRGHAGMAGEIGHTVVDPHGPVCLCGKRGCVERLASGPYMAQDYLAEKENRPILSEAEAGKEKQEKVTGQEVAERAMQGDTAALMILERGAWALGVGIGNAANLLNPQRVLLGGGVTKSGAQWWRTVRQVARQTALPEVTFDALPAALGDDAPLWGAVALAESSV